MTDPTNVTSQASLSGFPERMVERLFERLASLYGSKFADLWRGVDPVSVKRTWAEKLSGFETDEIKCALDACDSKPFPPTLPEFVTMCRDAARRRRGYLALPAPAIDKATAKKRLAEAWDRARGIKA